MTRQQCENEISAGGGQDLFSSEFKILVADDSPVYTLALKQALEGYPCLTLFAKNGRVAMDLFAEHRPPLVITDWVMPYITGPELCRRIRQGFPDVYSYLMLLTSSAEKNDVVTGLAAGADDYLTKPFHTGELLARVGVGRRVVELQREVQSKNRLLEEMALTDALTGLPNRRAIDFWAPRQLSAAARHGFPVWVVMADLDYFKSINDAYGHAAGDLVLRVFADILRKNTRTSNICGRIGGEEFLLVLTHAEQDNVAMALDRIRQTLHENTFTVDGKTFPVTASFGVSGFRGPEHPEFNALVAQADSALYTAKQKGRNRIEFHG